MSLPSRLANNWRLRWAAVRELHGSAWWNEEPLIWVAGTCLGCVPFVVAVLLPYMRPFVRWPYEHPQAFYLGGALLALMTGPGLVGLLVALFTPSRTGSWLARHFTRIVIIYVVFQIGLHTTGLWLLRRH
jgi:xanthine/uracil permease